MIAMVITCRTSLITPAITIPIFPSVEVTPENMRSVRPLMLVARVERQRGATPGDCLRQVILDPRERSRASQVAPLCLSPSSSTSQTQSTSLLAGPANLKQLHWGKIPSGGTDKWRSLPR